MSILLMLEQLLHATHPLKLLDKMCKYDMDPMSIVEDTGRTESDTILSTDGQMDRWTDGQGETSIPLSLKRRVWLNFEKRPVFMG